MSFFQQFQASAAARTKETGPVSTAAQPWIEKYRPKNIQEVSAQEEAVRVLRHTIESKNLPHLLFYGPPGTGKTSTILALARQIFGHEHFKSRVLELNASDERGIKVVREKVKAFARVSVQQGDGSKDLPPYKIIILDEADSMTVDAQSALRRTMETYSKVTRFCLICNYVSRIIEPLASRCAKFRFKPLAVQSSRARLVNILGQENIDVSDDVIDTIIRVSEGDLRKAITHLQSAHRMSLGDKIRPELIYEISGTVPHDLIEMLFNTAMDGGYPKIMAACKDAIASGYSAIQILNQFNDHVSASENLDSLDKSKILYKLANVEKTLQDGGDEFLHLLDLLLNMKKP